MITNKMIKNFLEELDELKNSINFLPREKEKALQELIFKISSVSEPNTCMRLNNINMPFTYNISSTPFNQVSAILLDLSEGIKASKSKKDIEILKLLKNRFENIDFDLDIAKMITGSNKNFPRRTRSEVEYFFHELCLPANITSYTGDTSHPNDEWIAERLKENNIAVIYHIIKDGLFKKKYFKQTKEIEKAKNGFRAFLENGTKIVNLSDVFNLNIKNDLLFNKNSSSRDSHLNNLIDQAKQSFVEGNKQIALEKIWDALERTKSLTKGDKKQSVSAIITLLSDEINSDFFNNEFKELTQIGNNYQIRHFEKGVQEIKDNRTKEYLFFRALGLIELILAKVLTPQNSENITFDFKKIYPKRKNQP